MIPKFKKIIKTIKSYKIICYVLIGYNSTHEENMHRVKSLSGIGVDPFVMPWDKSDTYQARFARWVNNKAVYNSCDWKDYEG